MPLELPPLPSLPTRLAAPAPGWVETTDVVVVGSGIAGLTTALYLREAGLHVTVVTKVNVGAGSTRWAQGGIAAVLDPHDTPAAHAADTLTAGAGLCDPAVVELLVAEGPARLRELIRFGVEFDRNPDGGLMLTREGGHRADRVAHAGGDATGAEVQRALEAVVRRDPWIRLVEHALVVDLLTVPHRSPRVGGDPYGGDRGSRVAGVSLHVLGEGTEDGVGAVAARAVVLATGGLGQVFAATTNPPVSTGDGVALALRAGATVSDLEFVQFHPTALAAVPDRVGRSANGAAGPAPPRPLISEALRGEGAHLVDAHGERFLVGAHELAELAPRDVVAKASFQAMRRTGSDQVFLDARRLGREYLDQRFPTIVAACRAVGVDPAEQLIPVAPAAHYANGGVRTDRHGRTSVPGLYACGEVARTGVHGANRLASNSLLEALVFARRIATEVVDSVPGSPLPDPADLVTGAPVPAGPVDPVPAEAARGALQRVMTAGAGVRRSADSLAGAGRELVRFADELDLSTVRGTAGWELVNLVTVASVLVAAAHARQESRGCHWRSDRPEPDDVWQGQLCAGLTANGRSSLVWGPV